MTTAVIYTDLDGTLLDHCTYDWSPARPALEALTEKGIPVVFVTSKTLAETLEVRAAMGNMHPFVVENGGMIGVPRGYFADQPSCSAPGELEVDWPGPAYAHVLSVLGDLRGQGFRFRGFTDMSDAEVASLTGLDEAAAARARQREASEPLVWEDSEQALKRFRAALRARGLQVCRGGRFLHVLGRVDKGQALRRLHARFRRQDGAGTVLALALGDSPNDLDMLGAADAGVLVGRTDGSYAAAEDLPGLRHAPGIGPAGWRQGIEWFLAEYDL